MALLSDLLAAKTKEELVRTILGYLQGLGFPTTDWLAGGVEKTRTAAWAAALMDAMTNYVPQLARAGFVDLATGPWLQLLAAQRFGTKFNGASYTRGTIHLTNASPTTYTISPSQMIVQFSLSGNRYTNADSITLGATSSVDATFQSEFPNDSLSGHNYIDSNGGAITLVTSYPGVTASNPGVLSVALLDIAHAGSGTGTIALSGSAPVVPVLVTVRMDTDGQAGAAGWSYAVNGAAFVSAGLVTSAALGGDAAGVTVTLSNGGTNPSFIKGDTYQFASPGSWVTQQGTDVEADLALASRCRNAWPTLASPPTLGLYDRLAREASSQVTRTVPLNDPTVNNKVAIFIAGQGGALPIAVLSAVQSFIKVRTSTTDYPIVLSPATVAITIIGTVYYDKSFAQSAVSAAIATALDTYIDDLGINGVIDLSQVVVVIHAVSGVKYVDLSQPLTINGAETNFTIADANGLPAVGGTKTYSLSLIAR